MTTISKTKIEVLEKEAFHLLSFYAQALEEKRSETIREYLMAKLEVGMLLYNTAQKLKENENE